MKLIELLHTLLKDRDWPESLGGYYVQDGDDGLIKWSKIPITMKCSVDSFVWELPEDWRGCAGSVMPSFRKQPLTDDWDTSVISRDMYVDFCNKENVCKCASCHEGDDYKYLQKRLSPEDQKVLERLYAELVHTRIDLNWYEAVFDGSWPNAEEHMRRAGWVKVH